MWEKFKKWATNYRRKKAAKRDHDMKNLLAALNGQRTSHIKEIYPCDHLLLTVCFEKDKDLMAVDFSKYKDKSLIHFMCYTDDPLPRSLEGSPYEESKMISRLVHDAAVYLKTYADGSELWCYTFYS